MANTEEIVIRDVWRENLEEVMHHIREIVDDFPLVAMDTEFPGVVVRTGLLDDSETSYEEENYQTMKSNVNLLKLIQLGLAFTDEKGNLPVCKKTGKQIVWQINFCGFDPETDIASYDSLDLLRRSSIDFQKNMEHGVCRMQFAELLMSSGVVLNSDVQWITFHGCYDFGYLLKILLNDNLPETSERFFELVRAFFPCIYDVKYMMIHCQDLYGGLNQVAGSLQVKRIGISHQAGSDSHLTACVFPLVKHYMKSHCPEKLEICEGKLNGLHENPYYSLAVRDLSGLVKPEDMVSSEHLATLLAVVPKYSQKDWLASYETISNFVIDKKVSL